MRIFWIRQTKFDILEIIAMNLIPVDKYICQKMDLISPEFTLVPING